MLFISINNLYAQKRYNIFFVSDKEVVSNNHKQKLRLNKYLTENGVIKISVVGTITIKDIENNRVYVIRAPKTGKVKDIIEVSKKMKDKEANRRISKLQARSALMQTEGAVHYGNDDEMIINSE